MRNTGYKYQIPAELSSSFPEELEPVPAVIWQVHTAKVILLLQKNKQTSTLVYFIRLHFLCIFLFCNFELYQMSSRLLLDSTLVKFELMLPPSELVPLCFKLTQWLLKQPGFLQEKICSETSIHSFSSAYLASWVVKQRKCNNIYVNPFIFIFASKEDN